MPEGVFAIPVRFPRISLSLHTGFRKDKEHRGGHEAQQLERSPQLGHDRHVGRRSRRHTLASRKLFALQLAVCASSTSTAVPLSFNAGPGLNPAWGASSELSDFEVGVAANGLSSPQLQLACTSVNWPGGGSLRPGGHACLS